MAGGPGCCCFGADGAGQANRTWPHLGAWCRIAAVGGHRAAMGVASCVAAVGAVAGGVHGVGCLVLRGSLRHGHIPLITRIVEGLHRQAGQNIGPLQYRYGRRLTLLWTVLLTGLTVVNGVLELCAVPSGVLAQLGQQPWLVIPDGSVSVYVNLLDYALIGIFFIGNMYCVDTGFHSVHIGILWIFCAKWCV